MAQQQKVDEFQFEEEVGSNRIAPYKDQILQLPDPEERMLLIMEILDLVMRKIFSQGSLL